MEIGFGVIEATLYLISGNGPTADWYQNLVTHPEGHGADRTRDTRRRGERGDRPEERRRVGDVMGAKYVWDGDPAIGLTYPAWCYEVQAVAVEL